MEFHERCMNAYRVMLHWDVRSLKITRRVVEGFSATETRRPSMQNLRYGIVSHNVNAKTDKDMARARESARHQRKTISRFL